MCYDSAGAVPHHLHDGNGSGLISIDRRTGLNRQRHSLLEERANDRLAPSVSRRNALLKCTPTGFGNENDVHCSPKTASEGVVGSVAEFHYSLMGAGWPPQAIEPTTRELATRLREDEVDAVCLVPV